MQDGALPPVVARALPFVVAWLVMEFAGSLLVPRLLKASTASLEIPPPSDSVDRELWNLTIHVPATGKWIGALERLLFYLAVLFRLDLLIAAWLAFKVATKWEVWQNIVKLGAPPAIASDTDIRALRSRWSLGSYIMTRFLVGTLSNLLLAMLAAGLGDLASVLLP